MCTIMQKVEDKGRVEGRAEGRTETLFELVLDGILTNSADKSPTSTGGGMDQLSPLYGKSDQSAFSDI